MKIIFAIISIAGLLFMNSCSSSKPPISSLNLSLGNFQYSGETLDMTLYNKSSRTLANVHLDYIRSTRDTLVFIGEIVRPRQLSEFINFKLSQEQIKRLSLYKEGFLIYKTTAGQTSDSLDVFLTDNSITKVKLHAVNKYFDGAFKNYHCTLTTANDYEMECYASTDPLPILLIIIAGAIIVNSCDSDSNNKPAKITNPCPKGCKEVKVLNNQKVLCECPSKR